jgi:hypothetical protein
MANDLESIQDKLIEMWETEAMSGAFAPSTTYISTDYSLSEIEEKAKTYTGPVDPQESDVPEEGDFLDKAHNALRWAGFTPIIGNIADGVNAFIYGLEGEYGNAAIEAAAMIPLAGQIVSAQKVIKLARKTEGTTKIYRGVDRWYPGKMVKDGKFVGGGGPAIGARKMDMFEKITQVGSFYGSTSLKFADEYAKKDINLFKNQLRYLKESNMSPLKQIELQDIISKGGGPVLKFEVPNSFLKEFGIKSKPVWLPSIKNIGTGVEGISYAFPYGIPKEFLIKVIK